MYVENWKVSVSFTHVTCGYISVITNNCEEHVVSSPDIEEARCEKSLNDYTDVQWCTYTNHVDHCSHVQMCEQYRIKKFKYQFSQCVNRSFDGLAILNYLWALLYQSTVTYVGEKSFTQLVGQDDDQLL